jgi:hypothetical protein
MELLGGILLFIACVWWIGFIGFLLFAFCGLIYYAFEDAFDGIAVNSGGLRNWWRRSERVNRYRAILRIKWTTWRAIRQLEDQAQRLGR